MAGLGRRTHYRKHLTDSVLHDLPEPEHDERIAKVMSTRGSNQFDIIVANTSIINESSSSSSSSNQNSRIPQLAILPTKFHKLVWVKRNDFVIVRTGEEEQKQTTDNGQQEGKQSNNDVPATAVTTNEDDDEGGIRFMITHILYKDQIKHLQSKDLWPINDPEFEYGTTTNNNTAAANKGGGFEDGNDDGIVYNNGYGGGYNNGDDYDYDDEANIDDDLFVNTNRIARLEVQDSSSSSSDDE